MAFITWTKGGEADVTSCKDDLVTVRSTIPSAPGSRLDGLTTTGVALRVKVARCRKDDAVFVIEGRLLDATRGTRDAIAAGVVTT